MAGYAAAVTDDAPPNDVAVIGAQTDLGIRICQMISAMDPGSRVLAVCRPGTGSTARQAGVGSVIEVNLHAGELDLHAVLSSVREVVHLAPAGGPDLDGTGVGGVDVAGTVRLFAAMSDLGIRRATVLSSAMVYGPWSTNPVPLTEAAPINPHPDLPYASRKAEVERVARDWLVGQTGSPGRRSLCVLRPTVMVSPDDPDWLSRSLWNASGVAAEVMPPVQFLHRDDLASAVALSVIDSLEGVYNVAPDGWVSGERIRALAGRQARVEVTRAWWLASARCVGSPEPPRRPRR